MIATVPIGQAPQALTYVPDAVPSGPGTQNLQSLGVAGQVAHLALAASAAETSNAPTSVSLFDQGLIQVLEAAVSGLQPKQPYVLALAENPDGVDNFSLTQLHVPDAGSTLSLLGFALAGIATLRRRIK